MELNIQTIFLENVAKDLIAEIGEIEVGIIDAKLMKEPKPNELKAFAGGKARKVSGKYSKSSTADNLKKLDLKYRIFSLPLQNRDATYDEMINAIVDHKVNKSNRLNRIRNAVKGLFLKPILIGKYGRNTPKTAEIKGFNRLMIDTGQTISAISVRMGKEVVRQ